MSIAKMLLAVLLPPLLAFHAARADAAIYCIDSVDQIQPAFDAANKAGTDSEIRLTVGKYLLPKTLKFVSDPASTQSLQFSGGWISFFSACDTQFADASLTELDGSSTASLDFFLQSPAPASLSVYNFSLLHAGNGTEYAAGLLVGGMGDEFPVPHVYVGNVIVRECTAVKYDCGILALGDIHVLMRNVLVAESAPLRGAGIIVDFQKAGSVTLNHVTVANNHAATGGYPGIYLNTPAPKTISNSILWNNDGATPGTLCDIKSLQGSPKLVNVIVGSACSPLDPASTTSGADPRFVDPDSFTSYGYHLRNDSPAREGGVGNPAGGLTTVDVDGKPRVDGALPDLGAFEFQDTVFADGFD